VSAKPWLSFRDDPMLINSTVCGGKALAEPSQSSSHPSFALAKPWLSPRDHSNPSPSSPSPQSCTISALAKPWLSLCDEYSSYSFSLVTASKHRPGSGTGHTDVWIWMQHLLSAEDVADAQISQLSSCDTDGIPRCQAPGRDFWTGGPFALIAVLRASD
jgi:hypothetical protein